MAKGSYTQSLRAYLREQEKAINIEARNQMKANNAHIDTNRGASNRNPANGHNN